MKSSSVIPEASSTWVHRLGYAGLLPFVLGAGLIWLRLDNEAHTFVCMAMLNYSALIVSFLGGIVWGLGFREAAPARGLMG